MLILDAVHMLSSSSAPGYYQFLLPGAVIGFIAAMTKRIFLLRFWIAFMLCVEVGVGVHYHLELDQGVKACQHMHGPKVWLIPYSIIIPFSPTSGLVVHGTGVSVEPANELGRLQCVESVWRGFVVAVSTGLCLLALSMLCACGLMSALRRERRRQTESTDEQPEGDGSTGEHDESTAMLCTVVAAKPLFPEPPHDELKVVYAAVVNQG